MGRLFKVVVKSGSIIAVLSVIVTGTINGVTVNAAGEQGSGGDGGGIHNVRWVSTSLDGNFGGASWHIFSTKSYPVLANPSDVTTNTLVSYIRQKRPFYFTETDALSGGGYDKKIATKCPKDKYDYYIAYVWHGKCDRRGKNKECLKSSESGWKNSTKYRIYVGPASWGSYLQSGSTKHYPAYNNYGAKTYAQIKNALDNGTDVNGWNIKGQNPTSNSNNKFRSDDAVEFYKAMNPRATDIPKDVGYFCVSPDIYSSKFEGKTLVSGAASGSIGYAQYPNPNTKTLEAKNCSALSGCKVTFAHSMKRTSGTQASSYTVTRSSNLTSGSRAVSAGQISKGGFDTTEKKVSESKNLVLYPGMKVCEKMTFKPLSNSGSESSSTQICVIATGNAQPDDPNPEQPDDPNGNPLVGNSAFLSIKVKNTNVPAYNKYLSKVYAKPGDNLTYRAVYNPVLQYTYNLIPDRIRINGGSIIPNSSGQQIWRLYNANRGSLGKWNNAFSVNSENFQSSSYSNNHKFNGGDTTLRQDTNSHQVVVNEVGRSLNEKTQTNLNSNTQTTTKQVAFSNNSNNNLGNIITTNILKTASALIPYNFTNTTEVLQSSDNSRNILYAGEKDSVGFRITTHPRRNNTTGGTGNNEYATIVREAKYQLRIRYEEDGVMKNMDTNPVTNVTLNGTGSKRGETKEFTKTQGNDISFNVPDLPAGTKIYVSSRVYPANSGAETNISTSGYSSDWAVSNEVVFTIAKKPSITIWGGNIYTSGKISTAVSNKTSLSGYSGDAAYNINPASNPKTFIFGSWTELGLIAGGEIRGLASGASTGVAKNQNSTLTPSLTFKGAGDRTANYNGAGNPRPAGNTNNQPGGKSNTSDFCARSILTISNSKNNVCNNGTIGNVGSSSSFTNANNDRENIINRLVVTGEDRDIKHTVNNGFGINDERKKTSNGSLYYYNPGDLSFNGGIINKNTTQMVHAGKNLTITGDIYYGGEGGGMGNVGRGYKSLSQIPRLVLYAEENVTIACNVERIDALIIAGKKVRTCDSNDINAKSNSTQLTINGAVITGSLVANRTYGASTGNNSIIPAEIINFDPSLYLWSSNNSESQGTTNTDSNLETTFITEVAPRY